MVIHCVWEHNGDDTLMHAENFPGAFTRGENKEIALSKMEQEITSYLLWKGEPIPAHLEVQIVQEQETNLQIKDADSDVIFDSEREPLLAEEYRCIKEWVMKSAADFEKLYRQIPDQNQSVLKPRKTFYGNLPCTALEMYQHTKNVNAYYFGEIEVEADNAGSIYECRSRGFELLERTPDFLSNQIFLGNGDELWSLRKVMRRFLWHDRIHAKAMWRMARRTFGEQSIENIFQFEQF